MAEDGGAFTFDKLDTAGVGEVLKSGEMASAINALAASVAGGVSVPAEVTVDSYTTDRAAASVTIKDARGMLWQARDGVLTRAAAGAGLEVRSRT